MKAVRRSTENVFAAGYFHRGGEGKTSTSGDLAAALARRSLLFDLPGNDVYRTSYRSITTDLDWATDSAGLPADPEVFDSIAKALGIEQGADADASTLE